MDSVHKSDLPWWSRPGLLFATGSILAALAAYLTPDRSYVLYWRSVKYMTFGSLLLVLGSVASFLVGSIAADALVASERSPVDWRAAMPWRLTRLLFQLSFWLCMVGYSVWAYVGVERGLRVQHLIAVIHGEKGVIEYLSALSSSCHRHHDFHPARDRDHDPGSGLGSGDGLAGGGKKLAIVLAVSVLRALFFSERLALIELVVCFVISVVGLKYREWKPSLRNVARLAPILAPALLIFFFTGFEYFRSWSNFYADRQTSLVEFGTTRLLGYYATAMDNGAYLMKTLDPPVGVPYFTLNFLWRFPGIKTTVNQLSGDLPFAYGDPYMGLLQAGANPEFNNASGVMLPFLDYGVPGGFVYWVLAGAIVQMFFRLFARREFVGLCMYPLTFMAVLEMPRILYWADGRAFLPFFLLAGASAAYFYLQRQYGRPRSAWVAANQDGHGQHRTERKVLLAANHRRAEVRQRDCGKDWESGCASQTAQSVARNGRARLGTVLSSGCRARKIVVEP